MPEALHPVIRATVHTSMTALRATEKRMQTASAHDSAGRDLGRFKVCDLRQRYASVLSVETITASTPGQVFRGAGA
jgi:hypothetical protein